MAKEEVLSQEETAILDTPTMNTETPTLKVEVKKTPEENMQAVLKEFPFLKYDNGNLLVNHDEYKSILKLRILKMGDMVTRGKILANLNGGAKNVDSQTGFVNACLATIQVGFDDLKIELLSVQDTELILGLFTAIDSYNVFFRKTPLGFALSS